METEVPADEDSPAITSRQTSHAGFSPEVGKRLDQVATTLIAATAAVSAVFAIVGANSDRIWVILDDATATKLLWATAMLALVAIALGLGSLLEKAPERQVLLLLLGSTAFVASLTFAVWTAATGANQFARPNFTRIDLDRNSDASSLLTFFVQVQSLDDTQRIGVEALDRSEDRLLYDATLSPDDTVGAEHRVTVPIPSGVDEILLAAWHRDRSRWGSETPICTGDRIPDGTSCVTLAL